MLSSSIRGASRSFLDFKAREKSFGGDAISQNQKTISEKTGEPRKERKRPKLKGENS